MVRLRPFIAVLILVAGALLAAGLIPFQPQIAEQVAGATVALGLAAIALSLARGRTEGRWLALTAGIASMPPALLALERATDFAWLPVGVLLAGLGLVVALGGSTMFLRHEGSADPSAWVGPEMKLVRYTFALLAAALGGIAALTTDVLAAGFETPRVPFTLAAFGLTSAIMLAAIVGLSRRRGAGLVMLALTVPLLGALTVRLGVLAVERGAPEGLLFALLAFGPALIACSLCLARFAGPVRTVLRQPDPVGRP
jgi:hypothetical protein